MEGKCLFKKLKIALIMIKTFFIKKLLFKTNLFLFLTSIFIENIVSIVFISIIYSSNMNILNFSFYELLFILGTSRVVFGIFYTLFSNLFNLGYRYIVMGEIQKYIIKPYSIFWQICLEEINFTKLFSLIFGIILIIVSISKIGIELNAIFIILFIILIILSSIVISSFYIIICSLAFFIKNFNFVNILRSNENISIYPINIYNNIIKFIFTFLIPFLFAGSIPFYIIKNFNFLILLFYFVVSLIFLILSFLFWRFSLKKYDGAGI